MTRYQFIVLVLSFNFPAGLLRSQEAPFPDFLAGTWQVEGRQSFEKWEAEGASLLKGLGYQLMDGVRKDMEALELKYKSGILTYTATVAGQNEGLGIDFFLTSHNEKAWTFENPGHDFPQKIVYHQVAPDTLRVDVSGDRGGFTLKMVRVE